MKEQELISKIKFPLSFNSDRDLLDADLNEIEGNWSANESQLLVEMSIRAMNEKYSSKPPKPLSDLCGDEETETRKALASICNFQYKSFDLLPNHGINIYGYKNEELFIRFSDGMIHFRIDDKLRPQCPHFSLVKLLLSKGYDITK